MPAHQAGLRNGDFILEVNYTPIETIEHDKVVDLIFSKDTETDLLVVEDLKGYKNILSQQEKIVKKEKKKLVKQNSTVSCKL
jgi:C-terminal processing protease CtpA/Prc